MAAGTRATDRWALFWQGFFALTLAAPTVYAVASAPSVLHGSVTVGVAAALAVWHWATALRHPAWEGRAPMLLWLVGALAFTWVLLGRDRSYLFLVYGMYPQVFSLLGRLAIPGAVALTLVVFSRTGLPGEQGVSPWLVSVGGSVVLAAAIGLFVTALVRQNEARKAALEALEATRAELATTSRQAGILAERERVSRDIHDTVAHAFTGIVMQLEASRQATDTDPPAAREHLDRALDSARGALGDLRRAVQDLRPADLEGTTLPEALRRTADRWASETGVPVRVDHHGTAQPLHPDAEVALLRTVQEALANVAKHAGAAQVSVELRYHEREVALVVADDGAGFELGDLPRERGLGLRGIRERATALGGTCSIDSAPGRGTRLTVSLPLP